MSESPKSERVSYSVSVYVMTTWATGSPKSTTTRTFTIDEERTILGGMRAIDAAVAKCNGHEMCDVHSPDIEPNPAALGWPLGSLVATDRDESESCQRSTPGCCVDHVADEPCETW